jgi:hypothetical protein
MAAAQSYFRLEGDDPFAGNEAHRYGSSPSNQRIECWWSFLRKDTSEWWIVFFKDMCESGIVDLGNILHRECLWFCFHTIIQDHLDKVKHRWNTHRIRQSKYGTVAGIPNLLYHLPDLYGGIDCKCPLPSQDKIHQVESTFVSVDESVYQEYFKYVIECENKPSPNSVGEAFNLFLHILQVSG